MKIAKVFSSASIAFMIPVACALMLLNYGMFDHFLRSIGKEILFTGIRVAIAGSPNPRGFDVSALKANIAASEFVRPIRPSRNYLFKLRANEVLIQRMGLLRYHFVLASPAESGKILVFEIFSSKILWLFHASTGFMWVLLLSFTWTLRRRSRREEAAKENLVKDALESWLRQGELSSFVSERFPQLVDWWERRQAELDRQTRVLHDIKVPLAALENGESDQIQRSVRAIQSIINTPASSAASDFFDVNEAILSAIQGAEAVSTRAKVGNRYKLIRSPRLRGSAEDFCRHLTNILMNAIEASREPMGVSSIIVEVVAEETTDGLSIAVKDWGKGIPAQALARLGKRGFTFGKAKGSGYGLHFCKKWIEAIGGRLSIRSEEGKGTTVTLSFPWHALSHDGERTFESIVSSGEKLIVFDDDPIFRDFYKMIFRSHGVRAENIQWAETTASVDAIVSSLGTEKFWIITDYFFDGVSWKGPEILKERKLAHRGILISNVDEREELTSEIAKIGLPFLRKEKLAERLPRARGQHDQPEQRVPADHTEQHPAGAV